MPLYRKDEQTVEIADDDAQLLRYYRGEGWVEATDAPVIDDSNLAGEPAVDASDIDSSNFTGEPAVDAAELDYSVQGYAAPVDEPEDEGTSLDLD